MQYTSVLQSRRKSAYNKGSKNAKMKHSLRSSPFNTLGLPVRCAYRYRRWKMHIPDLFKTHTTIACPSILLTTSGWTTLLVMCWKPRIKFQMRSSVARTWPRLPSITPPKVRNSVLAASSSCKVNPRLESPRSMAFLLEFATSLLVERAGTLSQYGIVMGVSPSSSGTGNWSRTRCRLSVPSDLNATFSCIYCTK